MKMFFIVNKANNISFEIDGLDLLRGKNGVTTGIYKKCRNRITGANTPNIQPVGDENNIAVFQIQTPYDWVKLTKKLYRNAVNATHQDALNAAERFNSCYIQIGNDNQNRVLIKGSFAREVIFPGGGSYEQISQSIQNILGNIQNDPDVTLANTLRQRIRHPVNPYENIPNNFSHFLNSLLVLICIVGPSRHYAMLAYVPMLLNLIRKAPGRIADHHFLWNSMFTSQKSYKWDHQLCPVTALRRWLDAASMIQGFLFRAIDQWGNLKENGLYITSVSPILKSLGQQCGFDFIPELSSHSLRRGLATGAARAGASFESIKRQGGWRSDATVREYIEEGQWFEDNAANSLLNPSAVKNV